MIIRKATIEDKEQIVSLVTEFDDYFAKSHLFSAEILPFTVYKNKNSLFESVVTEWLSDPKYFVFVAEDGGKVLGHIVGEIVEKKDRVLDKEGCIDEWFVAESARHKGVGRQLYNLLIEVFREQNCNHIGLKVYSANVDTIDMYHKMGFLDLEMTMVKPLK